jgi:hypothetical protein
VTTTLHPRVSVANGTIDGRTYWGATLDGRYHEHPRCHTRGGALKKARQLTRLLALGAKPASP